MKPIVKVEGVGKQYRVGAARVPHDTLRDQLVHSARSSLDRVVRMTTKEGCREYADRAADSFWALKDASFSIMPGEVVGIIGRNGAGKSTLLKVLSRITEPTIGRIELYGRVGSLLEVGTGFHPELTGRENIYLNGAILGMHQAEIKRKFDEIVAFAEVERFLDTPVKRYSSGMYTRLAFSVAAHLEPEILIVDEVLAVGDMSFQKKCLNKMEDVGRQGRTVLFVSHNMPAVTRLCERTILLDAGEVLHDGLSHQVVSAYLGSGSGTVAERVWQNEARRPGNDIVQLLSTRVCDKGGKTIEAADISKPVGVEIIYEVLTAGHVLIPNFHFFNEEGVYVFVASDNRLEWQRQPRPAGRYRSTMWIPGDLLAEGTLFVSVAISTLNPVVIHFFERDAVAFQVIDSIEGRSARGGYAGPIPGVVRPVLDWTTDVVSPREGDSSVSASYVSYGAIKTGTATKEEPTVR